MLRFPVFFLTLFLLSCSIQQDHLWQVEEKINGVSIEAPKSEVNGWENALERIEPNWVAIIPYAYQKANGTTIHYDMSLFNWQWWGEREVGVRKMIQDARKKALRIMLKPQLWVMGSWPGNLNYASEMQWKAWETEYRRYILKMSKIAAEEHVQLLCLGTELRFAARRTSFWKELVKEVRKVYDGKLTYAANWDNYQNVHFWDQLDYVGVDAYFPLIEKKQASKQELGSL